MPTRRHLLAAAGLAAASPGCMSVLGDDNPDPANDAPAGETGESAGEGVRLERLSVRNNHGEGHTVQLAVESGEGILHMDTYQLEAGGGTVVEGDWTGASGAYLVHARLDDGEIQSTDVTANVGEDTDCVRMVLRIDAEGELGILYGTDCDR